MIRKIILAGIMLCLFIAIPLATIGIHHVELGQPFLAFLRQTSRDLEYWKIAIPDIPKIPNPPQSNAFLEFVSGVVNFINVLISIINALIGMLNFVIQFTQYIFTLVKNLFGFVDTLKRISAPQLPVV